MAKDPAFLFYPGDFSTGTQFFSDEQVGKYVRILMAQHQLGHLDEKHMLHICKTYDKDVFSKFARDSEGKYFNQRLEDEIIKRKNYSKSRSENRKIKNPISSTYVQHMENENRNIVLVYTDYTFDLELQKFYEMLVKEMIEVWKRENPKYHFDDNVDPQACLKIAYRIAKIEKWKKADVVDEKKEECLKKWSLVVRAILADSWYSKLTLDSISGDKIWQKIMNSISTGSSNGELSPHEAERQKMIKEYYDSKK